MDTNGDDIIATANVGEVFSFVQLPEEAAWIIIFHFMIELRALSSYRTLCRATNQDLAAYCSWMVGNDMNAALSLYIGVKAATLAEKQLSVQSWRSALCCALPAMFTGSFVRGSVQETVRYVRGLSLCLEETRVRPTIFGLLVKVRRHPISHRLVAGCVLRDPQCGAQVPAPLFKLCSEDLGRLAEPWKRAETRHSKPSVPTRQVLLQGWQKKCKRAPGRC